MIAAANVFALAIAWWQRWPLVFLLLSYWAQSLVIGWYGRRRLLAVRRFVQGRTRYDLDATDGEHAKDPEWAGSPARGEILKRQMLNSAMLIYASYHAAFLALLLLLPLGAPVRPWNILGLALATLAFLVAHRSSYARNLENDRTGCPPLRALTFMPLIRVVPMHVTMVFGMQVSYSVAILLFGSLKTVADLMMHRYEHRTLARP
jgi:hypothetical protein